MLLWRMPPIGWHRQARGQREQLLEKSSTSLEEVEGLPFLLGGPMLFVVSVHGWKTKKKLALNRIMEKSNEVWGQIN